LEGLALAFFIAWYDGFNLNNQRPWSRFLGLIGEYSYSNYLLHFYFVFYLANWIHVHFLNLSNFYIAVPVAILMFFSMIPICYLSMRFLERPFLNLRTSYVKSNRKANLSTTTC
jgi:peptidoglycan/LPS O-acetylase OafA/YrhL